MPKATKKNLYLDRPSMHVDDYDVPVVDQISSWMKDMKLIREYVRHILLTEAMKRPMDLPEHIGVKIMFVGTNVIVAYFESLPGEEPRMLYQETAASEDGIYGSIFIAASGGCEDAWTITSAAAADGYGPLLYDVAIEVATMEGSGLVADRRMVSGAAQRVWQYYLDNRTGEGGDVEVLQCDDTNNSLTPDDSDNISQELAKRISANKGVDWTDSPLSKRFSKKNTMIRELDSLGKLILVNE